MSEMDRDDSSGECPEPVLARTGRFGTDEPFLHEEAIRPMEVIFSPLGGGGRAYETPTTQTTVKT